MLAFYLMLYVSNMNQTEKSPMSLLGKATPFKRTTKIERKGAKTEIEIQGLEDYAIIDSLIKSLEAVKDSYSEPVKSQAREFFLESDGGKKPSNPRGVEGIAEASIELRKRSTRSTLSDEEVALLTANDVPFEVIEDTAELTAFNPEVLKNPALVKVIEKALEKIPGAETFFVKQEQVARRVVSDDSVSAVFSKGLAKELLDVVTVLAIKAKLNAPADKKAIELVKKILGKN